MGKLTDITSTAGGHAIGDLGLLELIDELNDRRAASRNPERYHPIRDRASGALAMTTHRLPSRMDRGTPSQCYASLGPEAAVRAGYPRDQRWRPAHGETATVIGRAAQDLRA